MLQMLYRYEVGHSINKTIGEEVKTSIKSELKRSHDLTVGTPHKPVIKVADLFALVHFLWNNDAHRYSHERDRVQLVLFLLLSAYTLSRPGALVESSADGIRGSGDGLRYRDIKLTLIPNPVAGEMDVLVLEVTLLLTKGKRHSKEPTTYVLHERDDNLALCPVLHFLAVAFADQAFAAPNLTSPEALYQMKVEKPRHAIELEWHPQKKDMCIFRRAKKGFAGIGTSDEVLPYDFIRRCLAKAGQDAGFRERVTPYTIRRVTGNAVNSGATEAIRNQVMGHARGDVFKKYISQTVKYDVQSAYLGTVPRAQLIATAGRIILSRDRRVPTELSPQERNQIDRRDRIVALRDQRTCLAQQCKAKYVILQQAQITGGALAQEFALADRAFKNEVRYQRCQALKEKKAKFFATINVIEIQRQLTGSPGYRVSSPPPPPPQHDLPERARLACKLFETTLHPEQSLLLRLSATHDLIQLYARQEPRGPRMVSYKDMAAPSTPATSLPKETPYSLRCAARTCLFCLGNVALADRFRQRNFSSGNRLATHLEGQHYIFLRRDRVSAGQLQCPHPACSSMLNGILHFRSHAATVHGIQFTRNCGRP